MTSTATRSTGQAEALCEQSPAGAGLPLILASRSPRRAELLRQIGVPFEVAAGDAEEPAFGPGEESAGAFVEATAFTKMESVAVLHPNRLVLGADTLVVIAGRGLGKPREAGEAVEMLLELSGKAHEVYSGVALGYWDGARVKSLRRHAVTQVTFRPVSHREAEAYARTGEPLDKAGAYGIQGKGGSFIETIHGCYFNVVGLPLALVISMLGEFGMDVTRCWSEGYVEVDCEHGRRA